MNRIVQHALLALVAITLIAASRSNRIHESAGLPRSSPIAVSEDGRIVAAVNPDSGSVSLIDVQSHIVREIPTGRNPQSVALSADGELAFVANRDDDSISVIELESGAPTHRTIPACREPFGVVSHERALYVSCFGDGTVVAIDVDAARVTATVPVEIDPRGLALSADRARLYVTHFTSGRLTVIDRATLSVERVVATLADSNLSQSIFIDAAAGLAWLPQTRSNAANRALLFDTTVFPIVSVIDLSVPAQVPSKRIAIDVADRPSGIPIDLVATADRLFIVHAASNDLSVIDRTTGRATAHLNVGAGPRGAALSPDGLRLFVNNTLDGTVSVIDLASTSVVETIALTSIPLPARLLNGKRLFNSSADPRLARDRWIACATCHFDGDMDRRTWFFRDGPRNTPTLRGLGGSAPFHWSGDLDELEDVESTIRLIQAGTGLAQGNSNCEPACDRAAPNHGRSADLDDLAAFTASLRRAARPHVLSLTEKRGREIFFSPMTRCSTCHPSPQFLDGLRHDVGTVTAIEERKGLFLDTPTLLGISGTAPYFHDGSAATLLDAVRRTPPDGKSHGHVSHLSDDEVKDLAAYLGTIGSVEPRRRSVRR